LEHCPWCWQHTSFGGASVGDIEPVFAYLGLLMHGKQPVHQPVNPVTIRSALSCQLVRKSKNSTAGGGAMAARSRATMLAMLAATEIANVGGGTRLSVVYGDSLTTCQLCHPPLQLSKCTEITSGSTPSLSRRGRQVIPTTRRPDD